MSLEAHPVIHYILEFCCYNIGLLMNVLVAAHLSTSSKNSGVQSVLGYFRLRWIPLTVRWTACIFLFFVLWENPSLPLHQTFEKVMGTSILPHLGTSGFLGFGCDEMMAKVTALLGMQRELPPVPPADATT